MMYTVKGGSWYDGPAWVRSATRVWFRSDYRFFNLGFRPTFRITTMNKPNFAKVIGADQYGEFMVIDVNGVDVTIRKIEPGEVIRESDNKTVRVDEEFWILDTPVTIELWEAVIGSRPKELKDEEDTQKPVIYVSWHDSQEFVKKFNECITGVVARLPYENEWEYAARAGSTKLYANGTDNLSPDEAAFFYGVDSPKGAVPVKSYAPNNWGLYDVHGNVWEWCQDEYK